ncbi:MAG TPA: flavin reductase family protein [Thermoleophilaceae bacterium]
MGGSFEKLMGELDYPLYVLTAAAGDQRSGCLIGFATQTSIHPPRFLACVSRKNHTHPVAVRSEVLAVHVLRDEHRDLAELFGGETGDEVDKLAHVCWRPGPGGVPLLADVSAWFAGRVIGRFDLGDHEGFLLEPLEASAAPLPSELSFQEAKDIEPGHEP